MGPGSQLRLAGPQEGRGKQQSGRKTAPHKAVRSEWPQSRLPLILTFGWEPRREAPSAILSQLRTYAFPLKQINNLEAVVPSSSPGKTTAPLLVVYGAHLCTGGARGSVPAPASGPAARPLGNSLL